MDISMQLVEQQCGRYLTTFADCLRKFPDTWHIDCQRQKIKLAKCAESEPTIVKIKTECEKEFVHYERCMNSNPVHTYNCLEDFAEFNKCAEEFNPSSENKKQAEANASKTNIR
ncbi:coiled-coil-helix-coiled-coil-helix domain-containing protein 5-like isoform X2 [Littorina saxatilis]|uniref:IMS import disulfide relay-system CHCH-CHCH-like Cx9C domain-containing protein n=1 Tax=Littorina saxatilis TaxID=31220 RepID=A0AAN9G3W0_9CAEN